MSHEVELLQAKVVSHSFDVMEAVEKVVNHSRRVVRAESVAWQVNAEQAVPSLPEVRREAVEGAAVFEPAVQCYPGGFLR